MRPPELVWLGPQMNAYLKADVTEWQQPEHSRAQLNAAPTVHEREVTNLTKLYIKAKEREKRSLVCEEKPLE